jgi:hypothetical protein
MSDTNEAVNLTSSENAARTLLPAQSQDCREGPSGCGIFYIPWFIPKFRDEFGEEGTESK